jgi:hypothetical protein
MQNNVIDQSKDITILELPERVLNKGVILIGETLMKLEMKMEELKKHFNLTDRDLNINLGSLGDLM